MMYLILLYFPETHRNAPGCYFIWGGGRRKEREEERRVEGKRKKKVGTHTPTITLSQFSSRLANGRKEVI